ncbi:DUF7139 domain-containing protein [Haloferax larsenii]|uniref:Uncharacterized protein n=1 Tax=Haloferax larsenii TaxID=302484 RepID=A0A1H7GP59_HALLR|nr:ribonuclease BN [Haloferax larsenii]SEK39844.1 hypothetical protein SAMN04488691_101359 [Haloferax larsenii]
MTSLSEAYHGGRGGPSLRRLSLGFGVFLAGALLVIAGIVVATTDVYTSGGATLGEARELGGILGGVGVPAVFLGVFTVLPASRRTRAAAIIGASIAILGVALFSHAYPCQWSGATCGEGLRDLTLETVGVYFFGAITTFWCLFVGVANFKTRNDPGGTATVQVTKKGETRVVEVEKRVRGGLGGIGFLGGTPDGDVDTQTNAQSKQNQQPPNSQSNSFGATTTGATDGGASTQEISSPLDGQRQAQSQAQNQNPSQTQSPNQTQRPNQTQSPNQTQRPNQTQPPSGPTTASTGASSPSQGQNIQASDASEHPDADRPENATVGDRYCGNCAYFEYVRTSDGLKPYCAIHDEMMQDMEACDAWFPRGRQ